MCGCISASVCSNITEQDTAPPPLQVNLSTKKRKHKGIWRSKERMIWSQRRIRHGCRNETFPDFRSAHCSVCVCIFICVYFGPQVFLNSLKRLGLGRNHHRCAAHPCQVPRVELCRAGLGTAARLREFRDHVVIRRWCRREIFRLSALLDGGHRGRPRPGHAGGAVVHHRLSGRGPRARTTGPGGGQRIGLYQLGLGSLSILPVTHKERLWHHTVYSSVALHKKCSWVWVPMNTYTGENIRCFECTVHFFCLKVYINVT